MKYPIKELLRELKIKGGDSDAVLLQIVGLVAELNRRVNQLEASQSAEGRWRRFISAIAPTQQEKK